MALDHQLEEDGCDALYAAEDPVLAELWSNPENDVYGRDGDPQDHQDPDDRARARGA